MKTSILLLFAVIVNFKAMGSSIIYKSKDAILLYHIEKNETVKLIDCDEGFVIGRINYKENNLASFILYNDSEFSASSPKRVIREKEYLIKENECTLLANNKITIANETNAINLTNDTFYLESQQVNGELSFSVINFYSELCERYDGHYLHPNTNKGLIKTEGGSVFIFEDEKWHMLFKSIKNKGVTSAYYEPDVSPDGTHLICLYQRSKYNRRKVMETKLLEINIKSKTINDFSFLRGSNAKYSKNGQFILYKRKKQGYAIYNKTNGNINILKDAKEAYWIHL